MNDLIARGVTALASTKTINGDINVSFDILNTHSYPLLKCYELSLFDIHTVILSIDREKDWQTAILNK